MIPYVPPSGDREMRTAKADTNSNQEMKASVKKVAVPSLEENDVLIKVEYTAQNPTDHKHAALFSPPKAILGCDLSGTVVKLGKDLKNPDLKVGDKVACAVHGGQFADKGSYAEYARAESDMLWKVPGGLSMEEASTFGVPWTTALQAMVDSQRKSFPPDKVPDSPWYLVYGASSSVGLFAVQLGHLMGYKVLAVASPQNWSLLKSLGADECVDYHDRAKCVSEIKRISNGGVTIGLDTQSEGDSFKTAVLAYGEKGGTLNALLPPKKEDKEIRPEVEIVDKLMYTLFGRAFDMNSTKKVVPVDMKVPAIPEDRAFHVELCKRTPELITRYGIKGNPVKLRGGLDDIVDGGWEDMKAGKVRAQKLVYKIA